MLSRLSDEELLELASRLHHVLPLIIKARSGQVSIEERGELEVGIKDVLELLGIPTPFGGRLATSILTRRWRPLMEMTGISSAVDSLLELMVRLTQIVVRAEFDSRILGGSIPSPQSISKIDDERAGFVCEALGRLWLRDVVGGDWDNVQYAIIDARDYDALAERRVGERVNLYVAEIKKTLKQDHIGKIEDMVDYLKKYYEQRKQREKTIKSISIKSLYVIDFSQGPKPGIENELKNRLRRLIDEQEIHFIYLNDLKDSCRKSERVGHTLLKSIELLESLGIIGK